MRCAKTDAFTLVELSIVLVILGLLTGGILTGQSLIRAAELRSVVTDFQRFQAAIKSFRDKYQATPGDMQTATRFWGDNNTICPDAAVTNGSPGTCNGDGDGQIDEAVIAGTTSESLQFWNQLQLAGLLEGNFSGVVPVANSLIPGTDLPASKLANGGWSVNHIGAGGGPSNYAVPFGNSLLIGATTPTYVPWSRLLRPEEAWNIDAKVDDGKPARGLAIARFWNDLCAAADDGTHANNDYAASYKLSDNTAQCALYFRELF